MCVDQPSVLLLLLLLQLAAGVVVFGKRETGTNLTLLNPRGSIEIEPRKGWAVLHKQKKWTPSIYM